MAIYELGILLLEFLRRVATKKRKSNCSVQLLKKSGLYPDKKPNVTRFVCISDTHNFHDVVNIPVGDVLVHAGDFSDYGRDEEFVDFNRFLGTLPHPHKLIVSGNHDYHWPDEDEGNSWLVWLGWKKSRFKKMLSNGRCLEHEEICVNGIRIHGTAWNFNDPSLVYSKIRSGIDILITHKPPKGILDGIELYGSGGDLLFEKVMEIRPKVHIFGHIHESYGIQEKDGILFINAAICDTKTKPTNEPIVFDICLN
eukprot:Phypoly_transcript_16042.p1 GENE.Phypoly_transcript_16042~~Phypoly_transcript_16042.p1  ORF type:complete len:290 (+),score=36.88 Phypoly_transcript_16042:111-872(+)